MLPEEQRYSVIVRHPMPGDPSVRAEDLPPFIGALRFVWRQHGDSAVGVILLGEESLNILRDRLPGQETSRTGVSTAIDGLASLGRARSLAETAARTLREPGLAFLEDRLDLAIVRSSPDLARELQFHVLAPLLDIEEWRREVLLQTLEAWLEADGSTARAATRLFCHRNTVVNRLRRIEQMTNRSLSVPRDLVSLSLALRAYRQLVS
jgi:DNA-binding PucR family transcriptional regulator